MLAKAPRSSPPFQPTNFPQPMVTLSALHLLTRAPRARAPTCPLELPASGGGGGESLATDLCPGPGRCGSPTAALGMLTGSGGGRLVLLARTRRRRQRAGARLLLELWRPELELPGVSPTPPSSRTAAGARAGAASREQPAPEPAQPSLQPGSPRGAAAGEPCLRLGRVPRTRHRPSTSQAAR